MLRFLKHKLALHEKRSLEFRALQITLGVLIGLVLAGWLVFWQVGQDRARVHALHETASQAVTSGVGKIGGAFTLVDQDGKSVTDADFRSKYLLVYFGYTYCPDMCPTGLQSMTAAMNQLGADADKVQPLYITIDPVRDTPSKIKEYIGNFDMRIIGLTGTPEQIAAVAKAYKVYYKKGEDVDGKDYLMDHSTHIYLMDKDGHFVATYPEEVDPQVLVKALKVEWGK